MTKSFLVLTAFLSASAWGQVSSSDVTVTATRNANLQPDQAVFAVSVQSPPETGSDDVIAALQGSGITAANFQGASQQSERILEWRFQLTAALANMKGAIGQLSAVQAGISQSNKNLKMSYSLAGTQVSQQLQQAQPCRTADLVADARAQAQKLAGAAGMNAGAVLSVSGAVATTDTGNTNPFSQPASVPGCWTTVKFALSPL